MVILFDVDNTLLDNDRVTADLGAFLTGAGGPAAASEYFKVLETLRSELGYADYLGSLQRYRSLHPRDFPFFGASAFLVDYPFASRLYSGAIAAVRHACSLGDAAILSDGDAVFQPIKIARSGLGVEVRGRVHIYVHKEQELDDFERRVPADHYVMVDDKRRLLAAIKSHWQERVTTVWVRQGHYATAADVESYRPADLTIEAIGDFTRMSAPELRAAAGPR
jgi:FMN phosphatase YigB (HAD superfamily)